MIEADLYKPIKEYFENIFSIQINKKIRVEETHGSIPENIKELYPEISSVLSAYSYSPDLIGIIKDGDKNKLIIFEVKDDPLKLVDLYQAKRYSEIIKADYSFLLSPYNFIMEDEKMIKNEETNHLKKYYIHENNIIKTKEIVVGIVELIESPNIIIKGISFDTNIEL